MKAQTLPSLLLPFLKSHLSAHVWDRIFDFPPSSPPLPWGEKHQLPREGQQTEGGALEGGEQEGPMREKAHKSLEGQGRGRREERGRGQWPGAAVFPSSDSLVSQMRALLHGCFLGTLALTSLAVSSRLAPCSSHFMAYAPCGF